MAIWSVLLEFGDVVWDLFKFVAPLWVAVVVGIVVGWTWKPEWAYLGRRPSLNSSPSSKHSHKAVESSTSSSAPPTLNFLKLQLPTCFPWFADDAPQKASFSELPPPTSVSDADCSRCQPKMEKSKLVADDDLQYLYKLVHEKDGGPAWIQMMDRSTPTMSYQAWRRDRENGPPQYRSRTVFEDATPELVRDFFWDDEFRLKWDDMLIHATTLEECPITGTMVVRWVRKFPFFCSDREYIIGRRIWESGRMYYCVTKGVPSSSVPRCDKPRRVDLYYSSWCIRAVESKRGEGQLTTCEVLLFHYEDMGIPWEIAKLGVRQGMWGAVKKIEPGLRSYQKQRLSGAALSRCAFMAQINTKVEANYLRSLDSLEYNAVDSSEVASQDSSKKPLGRNMPKLLVVGGAIVLACSLDRGLLTKAVIFGVARRFAKIGRRL